MSNGLNKPDILVENVNIMT